MSTFAFPPTGWSIGTPFVDTADPADTNPKTIIGADAFNGLLEQMTTLLTPELNQVTGVTVLALEEDASTLPLGTVYFRLIA